MANLHVKIGLKILKIDGSHVQESNPAVLNEFSTSIGSSEKWEFHDVFGTDPELLAFIPTPVLAVMLLFPVTRSHTFLLRRAWHTLEFACVSCPLFLITKHADLRAIRSCQRGAGEQHRNDRASSERQALVLQADHRQRLWNGKNALGLYRFCVHDMVWAQFFFCVHGNLRVQSFSLPVRLPWYSVHGFSVHVPGPFSPLRSMKCPKQGVHGSVFVYMNV
jgi:hypothetical protein